VVCRDASTAAGGRGGDEGTARDRVAASGFLLGDGVNAGDEGAEFDFFGPIFNDKFLEFRAFFGGEEITPIEETESVRCSDFNPVGKSVGVRNLRSSIFSSPCPPPSRSLQFV